MQRKIKELREGVTCYEKFLQSFNSWHAYAKWANSYNLSTMLIKELIN